METKITREYSQLVEKRAGFINKLGKVKSEVEKKQQQNTELVLAGGEIHGSELNDLLAQETALSNAISQLDGEIQIKRKLKKDEDYAARENYYAELSKKSDDLIVSAAEDITNALQKCIQIIKIRQEHYRSKERFTSRALSDLDSDFIRTGMKLLVSISKFSPKRTKHLGERFHRLYKQLQ